MPLFTVYVTETLQRKCEYETETEEEALEKLEAEYYGGGLVLDYNDLVDTEFSCSNRPKQFTEIMDHITTFCRDECCSRECCPEEECVLFRIEKTIEE